MTPEGYVIAGHALGLALLLGYGAILELRLALIHRRDRERDESAGREE